MKKGPQALEGLLTLAGERTWNLDALVDLLLSKGVITEEELDQAMIEQYTEKYPGVTPADWARRCIGVEDNEALDTFFGVKPKE